MNKIYLGLLSVLLILFTTACVNEVKYEEQDLTAKHVKLKFNEITGECEFAEIRDGIVCVKNENKKIRCMNLAGEFINDNEYVSKPMFNEGLAFVIAENGDTYYINTQGEKVIDEVDGKKMVVGSQFLDGVASVQVGKDSDVRFIDKKGTPIKDKIYQDNGLHCKNDDGAFYTDENGLSGVFDVKNNKRLTKGKYISTSHFFNKKAVVLTSEDEDVFLIIDNKGKVLTNLTKKFPGCDISSSLAYGKEDVFALNFEGGKHSVVVDLDGNVVFGTKCSEIGSFKNGMAPFKKDGKYGLLDRNGNEIIPAEYDAMSAPYKDKVVVKKDNKWFIGKIIE